MPILCFETRRRQQVREGRRGHLLALKERQNLNFDFGNELESSESGQLWFSCQVAEEAESFDWFSDFGILALTWS
jgi:hypothetical protein